MNVTHKCPIGLILLLAVVLGGCATPPRWPAISESPTAQYTAGRWVWIDLLTRDVDTAQRFYSSVFGWTFEPHQGARDRYLLARDDGRPVAGIVADPRGNESARKARWLGLLSVADVAAATQDATEHGGAIRLGPRDLKGRGEVAVLADPEGAVFAIIRTDGGDPPDRFPEIGNLLWMELWAADGKRMATFYESLAGYHIQHAEASGDFDEWHLVAADYPRAGIVQVKGNDRASAWLPYIRVADLSAALARAEAAGAQVLVAPAKDIRAGRIAVIIDPVGAALGLAEWPESGVGGGQ
ncbi:MAG: VOC family protein [Chromatiaceae bacterium]|nr:VOC family protein [Chromatiaceae bacterium]